MKETNRKKEKTDLPDKNHVFPLSEEEIDAAIGKFLEEESRGGSDGGCIASLTNMFSGIKQRRRWDYPKMLSVGWTGLSIIINKQTKTPR